jgi:LmbE family N-acetylglucosaminyl deacetylase
MQTLAAVFAHPDDETFSMAGTLARLAARGSVCQLYCATDGDAGRSSGVAVASRAELGAVRRRELQEAAHVLGVAGVRFGGYPDGRLKEVDADVLVGEIVRFLRELRPQVVVTFGPEGAPNTHTDHRAISRAATAAFFLAGNATAYRDQLAAGLAPHGAARLYYVTWEPPPPDQPEEAAGLPPTARVPIAPYHAAKRAAFRLHATQSVHEAQFERRGITPHEAFAFVAGTPQPAAVVDDLFAGL